MTGGIQADRVTAFAATDRSHNTLAQISSVGAVFGREEITSISG